MCTGNWGCGAFGGDKHLKGKLLLEDNTQIPDSQFNKFFISVFFLNFTFSQSKYNFGFSD